MQCGLAFNRITPRLQAKIRGQAFCPGIKNMSTFTKIFGTVVALILILAGGADGGLTSIPGLAMLAFIWGFKW